MHFEKISKDSIRKICLQGIPNQEEKVIAKNILYLLVLLSFAFIFTSCANYQSGTALKRSWGDKEIQYSNPKSEKSNLLVAIRYPAIIERTSQSSFESAFGYYRPNDIENLRDANINNPGVTDSFSKTIYYVNELYKSLSDRLPEDGVILVPQRIINKDDHFIAANLEDIGLPPAAIVVDFFTYTESRDDILNPDALLTFGNLITPMMQATTAKSAMPETNGALILTKGLYSVKNDINQTKGAYGGATHTIIDHLNAGSSNDTDLPRKHGLPYELGKVMSLPLSVVDVGGEKLENLDTGWNKYDMSIITKEAFVNVYVNAIIDILNKIDIELALDAGRQKYISYFDPELGKNETPLSQKDQTKLLAIKAFEKTEVKYLSKGSQYLYDAIYNGVYGDSIRSMTLNEYDYIKQQRDLADKEASAKFGKGLNTFMSIAAGAMAGVAASDSRLSYDQRQQISSDLQSSALISAQTAEKLDKEKEALGLAKFDLTNSFEKNFRHLYFDQLKKTSVMVEGTNEITAKTVRQLREQLVMLYNKTFSSYQRVATYDKIVMEAQSLLIRAGENPGLVDGVYGKTTSSAIISYQKKKGLKVDGEITSSLLRHLRNE